ncbi:MAG: hypothetical protein Q4A79_00520 [Candidatus Saccharibacteria bacterium]|jgi:hypothetical protein|nr:hypothetical protein [Candidatus Saccharibacteria bacterium]
MGFQIELNDTLQITKEQGFPEQLKLEEHLRNPFKAENFKDVVFEFKNKPGIRIYRVPPVRNFLVENINGKWVYWGLIYITEIKHDYASSTTSGKFKIIYINTPEEMKVAHSIIDRNEATDYFGSK